MLRRALDLAARGVGLVSPGPLVGTVLVDTNNNVVGEGFYLYDLIRHAETVALEQAGERARGATAYVSLEPHAHHGRTPPCTEALIKAGIRRVVASIEDPNPKVSGRGFAQLRDAGLEVCIGLLSVEATRMNEAYIHFMRTGRPFVHLKMAVSLDGKIATRTGDSRWITGEDARKRAHELRHQYDAVMVGCGTVRSDNPLLTDRSDKKRRRPLVRVVLDRCLHISTDSQLARSTTEAPVILFTKPDVDASTMSTLAAQNVELVKENYDLVSVLEELGRRSIQSVLVEGGATLAGLLMDADLVNKVTFFIAPKIIGGTAAKSAVGGEGTGTLADAWELEDVSVTQHGRDTEVTGYPRRNRLR